MEIFITIYVLFMLLIIGIFIWYYVYNAKEKKKIRERIALLASNAIEMTPQEFMDLRKRSFGGRGKPSYARNFNFPGVYILQNKTKNLYYVGQGKYVLDRVNSHFTGKGNGDVYADYKYGDLFTIRMIALEKSGFSSLNSLEKATIDKFDAYSRGYNKTRGNR